MENRPLSKPLPNGSAAIAPWMQTASGKMFDLLQPLPGSVFLGDIAHQLARIARFNGCTIGDVPWNVAQHSILVMQLLPADAPAHQRLAALLHDAAEAYIGDVIAPMKAAMKTLRTNERGQESPDPFGTIEYRVTKAIREAFALPAQLPLAWIEEIKHADLQALRIEQEQLLAPPPAPWIDLPETPNPPMLRALPPPDAQRLYTAAALALIAERHGVIMLQNAPLLSRIEADALPLASPREGRVSDG